MAGRSGAGEQRADPAGGGAALIGLAFSPAIGLSVLGGAAVSFGNLLVLRRMVDGFRDGQSPGSALIAAGLSGVRYLLLGAALFAIIAVLKAEWIGVVCGLAAPLLAVVLELRNSGVGIFHSPSGVTSPAGSDAGAAPTSSPPPSSTPSPIRKPRRD